MTNAAPAVSDLALFERSALPMWIHDRESGCFLAVNDAMVRAYGWPRAELLSKKVEVLTGCPVHEALFHATPSAFVDGGLHCRRDGSVLNAEINVQEIGDGRQCCLVMAVDVTDRRRAEQQLTKSQRLLSEAQELAHVGSFEWEVETNQVRWSDELYRIYGLEPQQFQATFEAFIERIHPDDREMVGGTIRMAMQNGQPFRMEERIVRPDGQLRVLESRGHFLPNQQRLVGVCHDVTELRVAEAAREALATERRRREDELQDMADRLARTEAFSLVMVAHIGLDGSWIRIPPMLCKMLGYTEAELQDMGVEAIIHSDDLEDDRSHRARIVRGETKSEDIELRLVRKDGSNVWIYLNCSGVFETHGLLTHFIVYLRDITERHNAEERIRYQAMHDDLTDLPNRVLFNDRLERAIGQANRHDRRLAVITLDLDNFKLVNNNFGHSFGDILIRDAVWRLKSALRTTDTIARLGGDEFAIIVEDLTSVDRAQAIAAKARESIEDPFDIGERSVRLTACIGISIFPRDGRDPDTLFRSSLSALNRAKELGPDNIQLFDETMSGRFRDRLIMEQELHAAVQQGQLVSYYQPIVRVSDGRIVAVEALTRWNHPQRGIIPPDQFIPMAEETRLIVPIGEFSLRTSCRDVRRWIDAGFDLRLSVNLSARQFQEMGLLRAIDGILAETSFAPADLELEITETVAMKNADFTMNLLRDLRQRNISIAIDDFGAGQSSLIYLRQFPINTIKIDKVFISDMVTDATDAAIVRAVIALAHTLGLSATAEGVESEEQMRMLQEFECDFLQGYFISRPVPAAQFEELLISRSPQRA